MVEIASMRRRSWAAPAWLLIITAGTIMALALGYTIVLLAVLAAAVAGLLVLYSSVRAWLPERPAAPRAAGAPRARRAVWKADGTARQALLVPAEAVDGYQTVLTIDGYVLVNAEGQVVYALGRKAHDDTSEPVVVTILNEDAAVLG